MQDLARTSVLAPALSPRYLGELWQEIHSESLNKCFLKDDVEADANWSRLLLTKALVSPNQVSSWMVGNPYLTGLRKSCPSLGHKRPMHNPLRFALRARALIPTENLLHVFR